MKTQDAAETVRRLIDEELAKPGPCAAEAATAVLERMQDEHPAELTAWLYDQARETLRVEIGHLIRVRRGQARSASGAKAHR
jgi:hypothetical protein